MHTFIHRGAAFYGARPFYIPHTNCSSVCVDYIGVRRAGTAMIILHRGNEIKEATPCPGFANSTESCSSRGLQMPALSADPTTGPYLSASIRHIAHDLASSDSCMHLAFNYYGQCPSRCTTVGSDNVTRLLPRVTIFKTLSRRGSNSGLRLHSPNFQE